MALLKATRNAQWPLMAEFTFNFDDTMVDINGVTKDFKTFGGNPVVDAINLPANANVIGGELVVETPYASTTVATVSVGDSASATRYGSAINLMSAARTALTLTGFRGAGENLRLTFNLTVANATAGKATVRVLYTIQGRSNEVQTN
ncbi:MAG: hypothetical protein MOGMAGMI_02590 [Candidatus Omnitrophica bacterium]|nr:hypothetical protein [Candidatus Omnitrophota bacterium]